MLVPLFDRQRSDRAFDARIDNRERQKTKSPRVDRTIKVAPIQRWAAPGVSVSHGATAPYFHEKKLIAGDNILHPTITGFT